MKKFFKGNFKILIGIIIGVILSGGVVFAATQYQSNTIAHTLSNGTTTTVDAAIDDLYEKAVELTDIKYSITQSGYQYTPYEALFGNYAAEPSYSYTSLVTANTTSLLLRILYSNGNPIKGGTCLYYGETNKIFCVDYGYWLENGSSYDKVKTKLQSEMASALGVESSSISCNDSMGGAACSIGSNRCIALSTGEVQFENSSRTCYSNSSQAMCW